MAFSAGSSTDATDKNDVLKFKDVNSASQWLFREALDPSNNSEVCLPDDPELLGDLTARRFSVIAGKIVVESKDDKIDSEGIRIKGVRSRLGRSPDKGDGVVIAWWTANYGSVVADWNSISGLGHVEGYKNRWQ